MHWYSRFSTNITSIRILITISITVLEKNTTVQVCIIWYESGVIFSNESSYYIKNMILAKDYFKTNLFLILRKICLYMSGKCNEYKILPNVNMYLELYAPYCLICK